MSKRTHCLLEVAAAVPEAFATFGAALASEMETERQATDLIGELAGYGIEITEESAPVPMFEAADEPGLPTFEGFSAMSMAPDQASRSMVVPVEVSRERIEELSTRPGWTVWPSSELTISDTDNLDPRVLSPSSGGVDCRPFRPAVEMDVLRKLLGVEHLWSRGFTGQNIVVGIADEGVDGSVYPVIGGFARLGSARRPGTAPISSHGSMCAADVLLAAPRARLYDYPFLGVPRSGGALTMFQAALEERRRIGVPHVLSNSYGFVGVPSQQAWPKHEIWDINHPLHRKVREVVASGAPCFFSAGNCGANCPSGNCHTSGIGPGQSIHASNSLEDVITVAAVNSQHERIGYSSQGPGMFAREKPDLAAYSHFFGNFGPGRPAGGGHESFDSGTSAATPVAAGVGALLASAVPGLSPAQMKQALMDSAIQVGAALSWDPDYGAGVINAAGAYAMLTQGDT